MSIYIGIYVSKGSAVKSLAKAAMQLFKIVTVIRKMAVGNLVIPCADQIFAADDLVEAQDIVETVNPDLIVVDTSFGKADICRFLGLLNVQNSGPANVPVIIIGDGKSKADHRDEFIKAGAAAYIDANQNYRQFEKIIAQIKTSLSADNNLSGKSLYFVDDFAASSFIAGKSKAVRNTLRMLKLVAQSQCNPVLVTGQTGTGKELVAKAIHNIRHCEQPFVAINCAALTANLLESELFGHVKGSFTGADRDKTGLMELAGTGSILLDEISEMPLDLQAKLLRVLQEKTFRKVGGTKNINCRATIIASSNRNLKKEVQAKCFRQDLYYRLNVFPITLSVLNDPDRRQDIRLLAEYFLENSTICPQKTPNIGSLTKLAIEALEKHDWPGNIRELRNVIERAIILETTDKIGLSSIVIDPMAAGQFSHEDSDEQIKNFSLANAECKLISRALQETGWQKTRAAALLGITRATLYTKVKQYNIEKGSYIAKPLLREQAQPSNEPLNVL